MVAKSIFISYCTTTTFTYWGHRNEIINSFVIHNNNLNFSKRYLETLILCRVSSIVQTFVTFLLFSCDFYTFFYICRKIIGMKPINKYRIRYPLFGRKMSIQHCMYVWQFWRITTSHFPYTWRIHTLFSLLHFSETQTLYCILNYISIKTWSMCGWIYLHNVQNQPVHMYVRNAIILKELISWRNPVQFI